MMKSKPAKKSKGLSDKELIKKYGSNAASKDFDKTLKTMLKDSPYKAENKKNK